MFKFISFATLVAIAQAFQLQAVPVDDGAATGLVSYDETGLNFGGDQVADVTLEQPSGFATVGGKYLVITVDQIKFVDSISEASRDWGVVDGKFRSGSSSDQTWFYSCDDNKVLSRIGYAMEGCLKLELHVVGENDVRDIAETSSVEQAGTSSTQDTVTTSLVTTLVSSPALPTSTKVAPTDSTTYDLPSISTEVAPTDSTTYDLPSISTFITSSEVTTSAEATSEASTSVEVTSSELPQVTQIENSGNRLAHGLGAIGIGGVALLL